MPTLDPSVHDARIRYWNRVYRTALLLLVMLGVGLITFVAFRVNDNTAQTRALVIANQKTSEVARKTLTGYIKCLSLLRFDDPRLLSPSSTRQQVSAALDKCAVKE